MKRKRKKLKKMHLIGSTMSLLINMKNKWPYWKECKYSATLYFPMLLPITCLFFIFMKLRFLLKVNSFVVQNNLFYGNNLCVIRASCWIKIIAQKDFLKTFALIHSLHFSFFVTCLSTGLGNPWRAADTTHRNCCRPQATYYSIHHQQAVETTSRISWQPFWSLPEHQFEFSQEIIECWLQAT